MTSPAHVVSLRGYGHGPVVRDSYKLAWSLYEIFSAKLVPTIPPRGGFDQWLMARQQEAWEFYDTLRNGRYPSLGAMRRRWAKHLAYVRANREKMATVKGRELIDTLLSTLQVLVYDIDHLDRYDDFNPFCEQCGWDVFLIDQELSCNELRELRTRQGADLSGVLNF